MILSTLRRASLVTLALAGLSLTSCLSDGDDTLVLENDGTLVKGIPGDENAQPNPVIAPTEKTTNVPNIQYSVEYENGIPVVRVDMTGVKNPADIDWMHLFGTGGGKKGQKQNVWVELDGQPKGIAVYNSDDDNSEKRAPIDLVFTVDNSGSMDDEADAVARDITAWAESLAASGLDIQFGCVGFSVGGEVNGGVNLTTFENLATYLNHSSGTGRTYGFAGSDATTLASKASNFGYTGNECGAMAVRFADQNYAWRTNSNRIYVNFTDEPNQPDFKSAFSVEFFKDPENWSTQQGTIHTVYSGRRYSWISLNQEDPALMSEYTGGTTLYASSSFTGVTLSDLPVTGAMRNSYIIKFTNIAELMDGQQHRVKITIVSEDGSVKAEKEFIVIFQPA